MNRSKIAIYGPAATGKTTFVRNINGIEGNWLDEVPKSFPTVYVYPCRPENEDQFDVVLEFVNRNVIIIRKMKLF